MTSREAPARCAPFAEVGCAAMGCGDHADNPIPISSPSGVGAGIRDGTGRDFLDHARNSPATSLRHWRPVDYSTDCLGDVP